MGEVVDFVAYKNDIEKKRKELLDILEEIEKVNISINSLGESYDLDGFTFTIQIEEPEDG